MSVLIRGMEMPTNGSKMLLITMGGAVWEGGIKYLDGVTAMPVPEHGDLVERDALGSLSWNSEDEGDFEDGVLFVLDKLDELPVVIPADPAKEET